MRLWTNIVRILFLFSCFKGLVFGNQQKNMRNGAEDSKNRPGPAERNWNPLVPYGLLKIRPRIQRLPTNIRQTKRLSCPLARLTRSCKVRTPHLGRTCRTSDARTLHPTPKVSSAGNHRRYSRLRALHPILFCILSRESPKVFSAAGALRSPTKKQIPNQSYLKHIKLV